MVVVLLLVPKVVVVDLVVLNEVVVDLVVLVDRVVEKVVVVSKVVVVDCDVEKVVVVFFVVCFIALKKVVREPSVSFTTAKLTKRRVPSVTFITILLEADDPNDDLLSYQITQAPINGLLSGQNNIYLYTPNQDFFGTDSLKFTASDQERTSNEATIIIEITPINDPPVAYGMDFTLNEDSSLDFELTSFKILNDLGII